MDNQTLIVKCLLAVLFISMGLLIIVIIGGLISKTLDPQATVLVLSGIASGIIAGLIAKGGGDK